MKYIFLLLMIVSCQAPVNKKDFQVFNWDSVKDLAPDTTSDMRLTDSGELKLGGKLIRTTKTPIYDLTTHPSIMSGNIVFPNNPSLGQRFYQYIYDGKEWVDIGYSTSTFDLNYFPNDTTISYKEGNEIVLVRITKHIIHIHK